MYQPKPSKLFEKRPNLNPAPLPTLFPQPGLKCLTCSPGQWSLLHKTAYETGWTLLEIEEVNGVEKVVRAWKM